MRTVLTPIVFCLMAGAAQAETISSIYSDFDMTKCKTLETDAGKEDEEGEGGIWSCPGIKGYDLMFLEGDLRGYIAFGKQARSQCSSVQTFGHFNSPGAKIEWRMKQGKPFATILRWLTDNGEPDGKQDWLVVTKLNGADACRTALVDTKAPDANVKARELADGLSADFDCENDEPTVISLKKAKASELMSGTPCAGGPYREE